MTCTACSAPVHTQFVSDAVGTGGPPPVATVRYGSVAGDGPGGRAQVPWEARAG
ncbi:hypothetical protein [Streptomyces sp. NPDC059166]|uniref:hypothetical protein n=1 Tax=Streptomyces sp. NPDC059166 TaxID=3346752 RepID=UPI0036882688